MGELNRIHWTSEEGRTGIGNRRAVIEEKLSEEEAQIQKAGHTSLTDTRKL